MPVTAVGGITTTNCPAAHVRCDVTYSAINMRFAPYDAGKLFYTMCFGHTCGSVLLRQRHKDPGRTRGLWRNDCEPTLLAGLAAGLALAAVRAAVGIQRAAVANRGQGAGTAGARRLCARDRQVGVAGVRMNAREKGRRTRRGTGGAALVRCRGVAAALVQRAVGVGFRVGAEAQVEIGVAVVAGRCAGHGAT